MCPSSSFVVSLTPVHALKTQLTYSLSSARSTQHAAVFFAFYVWWLLLHQTRARLTEFTQDPFFNANCVLLLSATWGAGSLSGSNVTAVAVCAVIVCPRDATRRAQAVPEFALTDGVPTAMVSRKTKKRHQTIFLCFRSFNFLADGDCGLGMVVIEGGERAPPQVCSGFT